MILALVTVGLVAGLPGVASPTDGVIDGRDQVLAGIYSEQWESRADLDNLSDASGRQLSLSGTFHTVEESRDVTIFILEQSWLARTTPVANVTLPGTAAEIVFGLLDEDIERWAGQVKAWLDRGDGRSLMIAPMQEMNGGWTPYSIDPGSYKVAYGKFLSAFRDLGIGETQVRWVFAPNGWSTPPFQMADYYPGASKVDLIGISAFNWGGTRWTGVPATLDAALSEARSFASDKPFLITQVGSSSQGGDRDAWVRDLFSYAAADPNVVGLVYFNIAVAGEPDWRVWDGAWVTPGWPNAMMLPTTAESFPLTTWFQPGPLPFVSSAPVQGRFVDDDNSAFQADIEWLAAEGITFGCNPPTNNRFCPERPVTREEMASFLARALHLGASATDWFADDNGSIHEPNINALAQAGITVGCAAGRYCPDRAVARQEMASYLSRALSLLATGTDWFTDDNGSYYEPHINSLRESRITLGCTASTFCPFGSVTREQMAAFLHRALG